MQLLYSMDIQLTMYIERTGGVSEFHVHSPTNGISHCKTHQICNRHSPCKNIITKHHYPNFLFLTNLSEVK